MLKILLLMISVFFSLQGHTLPCDEYFKTSGEDILIQQIENTLKRELTPYQVGFIQKHMKKSKTRKKNNFSNSIAIMNFVESGFLIHEISTLLRNGIIKESRKALYNDIYIIEAMQSVLNQEEPLSLTQIQLLLKAKVFMDMIKWKKPVEMFEIEFFISYIEQIANLSQEENKNLNFSELEHFIRTVFKVYIKKTFHILQYVEKRDRIKQHLTTFNGLALAGAQRRLIRKNTFDIQPLLKKGFTVEDIKTLLKEDMFSSDQNLKQLVQDALDSLK